VVCSGWDASVRGRFAGTLRRADGYPHVPVVVGNDPALFGRFLDAALEFNARWHEDQNIVFLHAWNEWSECSAIEPSDRWGDELLAQVRARAGRGAELVTDVLRPDGVLAAD
jgi:hypothetical protein